MLHMKVVRRENPKSEHHKKENFFSISLCMYPPGVRSNSLQYCLENPMERGTWRAQAD